MIQMPNDIRIDTNPTTEFLELANDMTKYMANLPLDNQQNNKLIGLFKKLIFQCSKDAFRQGYNFGIQTANKLVNMPVDSNLLN